MKMLWFTLCFFSLASPQAQKLVKKAWVNPRTENIQIDAEFCYQVNLSTSKTKEVVVKASIEGEYAKDLLILIEEEGTNLLISVGFQPNFSNPNDKLSAHKVISVALDINLPEYKNAFAYGTNSNVLAQGKYKNLKVSLANGRCVLENVGENVEANTQKGDIVLTVPKGKIIADSTYGEVLKEEIPNGDNQFILNTVEGKIYLHKTK